MTRKPLMAGNWKMNVNHLEAIALVQKLSFTLTPQELEDVEVVVLPPFTDLRSVQTLVDGDKIDIGYGAQDLSHLPEGAHTGDISGAMLAKLGCSYVVVGHSERRADHGEDDARVAAKALNALAHGITPIVCVGEHLEVRQAGDHVSFCCDSLTGSLAGLSAEQISQVVVAYEPVWAIGTGEVALPEHAQEVCAALRATIASIASPEVAAVVRVLYGGSVKASNAGPIMAEADVDGALVGGASLVADDFAGIVRFRAT